MEYRVARRRERQHFQKYVQKSQMDQQMHERTVLDTLTRVDHQIACWSPLPNNVSDRHLLCYKRRGFASFVGRFWYWRMLWASPGYTPNSTSSLRRVISPRCRIGWKDQMTNKSWPSTKWAHRDWCCRHGMRLDDCVSGQTNVVLHHAQAFAASWFRWRVGLGLRPAVSTKHPIWCDCLVPTMSHNKLLAP